jgi:hypothetical protein
MPLNPSPQTLGRAIRISDRMTRRQYRRLDLYQLLGKRRHIEFAMDYWFKAANDSMWGLCWMVLRRTSMIARAMQSNCSAASVAAARTL